MNIPGLIGLEPGLPEPVLREADVLARAVPQLAALEQVETRLALLAPVHDPGQSDLSRAVDRALPEISAATQEELDELASRIRLYRDAVEAALATRDPLLAKRLASLESRIAEFQQLQDEKVAEERQQRIRIEEEREVPSRCPGECEAGVASALS